MEGSLEKGYLKEMMHLTYLDMSVLLTWFILFLRKNTDITKGKKIKALSMKIINRAKR